MALGDVIARLSVQLGLETAAFEKGATIAEKRMAQTQRKFEKIGKSMVGFGSKLSIGLTAPLIAFGVSATKAAAESRQALGQVEAALASMGPVAGKTSKQLQDMAKQLQATSTFDDDDILVKVTANMLTFGNITGDAFDKAQQAAIDLSARLGQDLQSSTIMLGKALNDPVKGLSALSRVGISFTETQKETIKSMAEAGNVAGAQALMLEELQKQYGGAAQAARDAVPGSDANDKWREFQETVGEALLTAFERIEPALNRVLSIFNNMSPEMQTMAVAGLAIAAALGPVLMVVGALLPVLTALGPVLTAIRIGMLLIAANPIILGLAAVIGGIYLVWKNWDKIEPIIVGVYNAVKTWIVDKLGAVWDFVKGAITAYFSLYTTLGRFAVDAVKFLYQGVKTWMLDKLGAVWKTVTDKIDTVKNAFFLLYDAVVGNSYIPDMVDGIAAHMGRLDKAMVDPAKSATKKAGEAFRDLASDTKALMDQLFPQFARLMQMRDNVALIERARKAGLLSDDVASEADFRARKSTGNSPLDVKAANDNTPLFSNQQITKSIQQVEERLGLAADKTKSNTVRIAKSFKDMADDTIGALRRMSDAIKGGGFLDILEGIIGLGMQLGSIGAFGKTIQGNINKSVPGFAGGVRNFGGGLAVVGERGPELVSLQRGSNVFSNSESRAMMGGRSEVQIIPSPYFDVVVDGRVQQAAPGIAGAGAQLASASARHSQTRRLA